ncbi:efflux RND transporter periplasmic adaptor subunit [Herbaspirillum sp. RV1423]|uniref:efflux RND transporter periplasmic adaptor subunit n=1 Tax=Herbaspirillum sp. RV1423 TaxID=1443993 RepID=UPI0004B2627C|nr:efflux RND transporter periplasmic adaptor subunit [Herbaspirillum sp. RV1423]
MKNNIFSLTVVVASIAAAGYGLYWLGMQQGKKAAAPVNTSAIAPVAGNEGKKVLYWHDPMVPSQKFDKPGKSPFMDMQLVPVYAGETADDSKVNISPRVQQNLGIRTAEVTRGNFSSVVRAVGNIAYDERAVALIQARSNGFVERLYVRAPLDPVRKGQALAEIYVPEWVAAQEEYLSIKRMQSSGLGELLSGARQRMRLVGMTDDQIRLIESTEKVQARTTIVSPVSGVVSELTVREGMTVMAGAAMFKINGLSTIWVNADVPEAISAQIRPGNTVEAHTPALPGTVFKGKVNALLPDVDSVTRTRKARIELANPDNQLVPGMFASVSFATVARKDVLVVPSEAVITTGTRNLVMLAQGDGKFMPVDVEIGTESNGQTEIRKGLDTGQKVVVSGQFLIDSEASLTGATTRMGGNDQPSPSTSITPVHSGQGKIENIDKEEVTISHGPIPSLQWGAMTMSFKLPAGGLPKNLRVGDNVAFEIRPIHDDAFQIARIATATTSPTTKDQGKPNEKSIPIPQAPAGGTR